MWTPKRILILFGGIFLFVSLFTVYSYLLPYDGSPNLPAEFLPPKNGDTPPPIAEEKIGGGDQKLLEAFGADCEELRRPIRLFLRSKGLAVSAKEFEIEPDGRVKLSPFSACLFPKGRPDGRYAEINTVKCDVAFLRLDKPAKSVAELSSRKIVEIELRSRQNAADLAASKGPPGILITNNRRTPQKSDDLEVRITNAPLYYDDLKGQIWTDGFVQLLDIQTLPQPTRITARGMEIHLARETAAAKPKTAKTPAKGKGETINGVETLVLRSNVDMYLYVDPSSGFLADPQDFSGKNATRPASAPKEAQEKSKVVITTNGPFHYDLTQELARFESPPPRPQGAPLENEHVLVTREHKLPGKATQQDQLWCHRLELQFRRKAEGTRNEAKTTDKEIETAHATTRTGKQVKLDMRTENLEAFGLELLYRCPTPTSGPQTILKGQPMYAVKDGHKIEARELHLVGADKTGHGQQAIAHGPGQIDLFDKANASKPYPLHAVWRDKLVSTKVREDGKLLDLLTLTGEASFIDEERRQELNGQKLQVWLEPGGASTPSPSTSGPTAAPSRQRPHRLEAFEKVSAYGQDMIVRHANHLVVRFKEDMAPEYLETLPVTNKPTGPSAAPTMFEGPPATAQVKVNSPPPTKPAPDARPRKPIELTANEVTAYVNRAGNRNQLQELVSEGNVRVTQEGQNPKDKGVDIEGEMLTLARHPNGDILNVFGDSRKRARLQMGEIILSGPHVTINQRENVALVDGTGVMDLPSNTNLDGGKASKPGSRLVVHWNKEMIFNGKFATFEGGVQAFQDNGSLKCQQLEVTLDHEVSLKEGQRGGQTAKVEKMLCDQKVLAVDEIKDDKGVVTSYRRGEFVQLTIDNQEGPTVGTGPGTIRFYGRSGGDIALGVQAGAPQPKMDDKAPKNAEMKVTQINFEGRMFSNNKDNTRTSKFYDNVEVNQFPAANPLVPLDPNKVVKGAFQLKCDRLSVYTKQIAGKASQLMWAEGKVSFRTDEFFGRADVVKFDEASDQVIFEAAPGNTVTITKNAAKGDQNQVIRGTKILYKRQTGEFILDGVRSIQSRLESRKDKASVEA